MFGIGLCFKQGSGNIPLQFLLLAEKSYGGNRFQAASLCLIPVPPPCWILAEKQEL